jgi:hypothetical protein
MRPVWGIGEGASVASRVVGAGAAWWSPARITVAVVVVVAALGLAAFGWIYGAPLTYDGAGPIRSDGAGYYVFLPAVLLDRDVTMESTAARSFGGDPANIPGVRRVPPRGLPLDQFGIGVAVMIAPFFAAGHLLALLAGAPRDGFSWPYEAMAAAAGFAYVLVGIALLGSVLGRWFSRGTVLVTLLAIVFGTNLFHYATYDSLFSHAFSFALVALILRLTIAVTEHPGPASVAGLGLAFGLLTLIRPTNLVLLVFCALYGARSLRERALSLARELDLFLLGCGVFLLLLLPQVAYWQRITGKPFAYGYKSDEQLDLLDPNLVGVLFSVRKGLFFWTPLLLLAVFGLPLLRRFAPALFTAALIYLLVHTWVVASWSVWWYGGSFGMRPFVEALPILALGLAALLEIARGALARTLVRTAVAATSLLALHGTIAYWTKSISYDGTTFAQYLDSFRYF